VIRVESTAAAPRQFSWQAWLALAYVLLLYPIGWGKFGHLHPGLQALVASGSRTGWYSFWGTVFVIEWIGFFLCLCVLRSEARASREIGLYSRRLRLYLLLFTIAVLGFSALFVAQGLHWIPSRPADPHGLFSILTAAERFFWLAMAITGGVCEETMFRGFAITYLRRLVRSTWLAVLLATLAFAYMHGGLHQGLVPFLIRFALGLVFAGIYLWRDSLLPGMFLHFLIDAWMTVQI
jgi:hypothetical protein